MPDMVAIDLITSRHGEKYSGDGHVWGVYAFNKATNHVDAYVGRATILATGGAGRTYIFSTAPRGATGAGIAMPWRAGCRVRSERRRAGKEWVSTFRTWGSPGS